MVRKILKQIICVFILFMAFSPIQLKAADGVEPEPIFNGESTKNSDVQTGVNQIGNSLGNSGVTGKDNVTDLVLSYVNFSLPYLALAAFLGFVYAGFLYVTSYGSEDQTGKAKKIMIYAVVGLIIVMLSYGIVQLFTKDLAEGIKSQIQ